MSVPEPVADPHAAGHPDGAGRPDPAGHPHPAGHPVAVHWLTDYVYGTIATLVAIAGLTFETNPGELSTAGVVIVGAIAIWFAHALARLVAVQAEGRVELRIPVVLAELRSSWSIVTAAVPATAVFVLAALHLWTMQSAFLIAELVGVAALAVVGIGTAGGRDRPMLGRILYVLGVVLVGGAIVLLEAGVHLL